MIGTALKNTILFLLIILLLNTLLINHLNDKNDNISLKTVANTIKNITKNKNDSDELEDSEDNNNHEILDIKYALPEKDVANNTDKMKQLYDFVFDDNADESLDNFYKIEDENKIKQINTRDINVRCADTISSQKKFCNTTETSKEAIQGHYSNFNKVELEGELKQKDKHFYLVNQFKDENINNGGVDPSGVSGFDSFGNNFDFY